MSRTMMLASAHLVKGTRADEVAVAPATSTSISACVQATLHPTVQPVTSTEQYWAARALTAETLLSARSAHEEELRTMAKYVDGKRAVRSVSCNYLVGLYA